MGFYFWSIETISTRGRLVLLKFWQFSSELTKTWSSGNTKCRVWIGKCNVKVWKSTEHKLHKIWHSLRFCTNSGKRAHPWNIPSSLIFPIKTTILPFIASLKVHCSWKFCNRQSRYKVETRSRGLKVGKRRLKKKRCFFVAVRYSESQFF